MSAAVRAGGRSLCVWLLVAVAAGLLAMQQGAVTGLDGESMLETSRSLVRGHLDVPADIGGTARGEDGRTYSKYGIGLPLLVAPVVGAAAVVGEVVGHQEDLESLAAASMIPLLAALTAVALVVLASALGASRRSAVYVALGALFGTFYLTYTKEFFSEPLTALALTVCIERTVRGRLPAAGAAAAVALLARPQSLVFLVVWALVIGLQARRRAAPALAIVGAGVALQVALNLARFGSPTKTGYVGEGFTTALWDGGWKLLATADKSVLLYAPIIVVVVPALWSLRHRERTAFVLITGNLVVTLVLNATWHDVEGGWSWGPRLLLPGIVPAIAPVAVWMSGRRWAPKLVVGLFVVGFAVSASTLVVPSKAQQLEPHGRSPVPGRQYELIPRTFRYTAEHLYERGDSGTGAHRRFVYLWQVNVARVTGRAGFAFALVLTVLLVVVALTAARRVVRILAADPSARAFAEG